MFLAHTVISGKCNVRLMWQIRVETLFAQKPSQPINPLTPTVTMWAQLESILCQPWAPECPDVKNYNWRLIPVWHRMLYSCIHMAAVARGCQRVNITWHWQCVAIVKPASEWLVIQTSCSAYISFTSPAPWSSSRPPGPEGSPSPPVWRPNLVQSGFCGARLDDGCVRGAFSHSSAMIPQKSRRNARHDLTLHQHTASALSTAASQQVSDGVP